MLGGEGRGVGSLQYIPSVSSCRPRNLNLRLRNLRVHLTPRTPQRYGTVRIRIAAHAERQRERCERGQRRGQPGFAPFDGDGGVASKRGPSLREGEFRVGKSWVDEGEGGKEEEGEGMGAGEKHGGLIAFCTNGRVVERW